MTDIITPSNPELFPLLESKSQFCSIPLGEDDLHNIINIQLKLEELGDTAIGLAASQIGWPRRVFCLRHPNTKQIITFINPIITYQSSEKSFKNEACLSLPGQNIRVKRPKRVKIKYFNLDGELIEQEYMGIMARAVMHEMDHLNGTLILSYADIDFNKQLNRILNKSIQKNKQKQKRRKANKLAKRARRK